MTKGTTFHDYVVFDLFGDTANITSKAMFGGWAIYKKGISFAIIVGGELYFKIDDSNRPEFERLESHSCVYSKNDGKPVTMWVCPNFG